ncbi:Peroxisome biogenesis protein 16 [Vitis vinifera]|uniref:Peroxisomal membrane protein PEX16 n=1 Tax=Vitis vinifera TaxID=29760 RepID=A0A438IW97_VITVI|nr:Peroxisome biogenesis protein 16 [Vitis vinifera]
MRVILPPLEINCLFHMASLFQNLSSTPSHTSIDLCEAPNKWKEAPPPCNQAQGPKSLNSLPSPIAHKGRKPFGYLRLRPQQPRGYSLKAISLDRGLTWLLPERFSSSEIGPEAGFVKLCVEIVFFSYRIILSSAVTAFLGIITAINEHIIDSTPTHMHTNSTESSFPYSLCISALKDLETLVEVVAEHFYGNEKKWNFIAITEATKVLVRLALFHNHGYKMLLHGGETPNVENSANASSSPHSNGGFTKPRGHHGHGYLQRYPGQNPWNLEGRALSALSRFGDNARMVSDPTWLHRVQQQQAIMDPQVNILLEFGTWI